MHPEEFDSEAPLLDGMADIPAEAFDMPIPDPAWKAQLLAQTTAVVRGRRNRRRIAAISLAITAYAAGIISAILWLDEGPQRRPGPKLDRVAASGTHPGAAPLEDATPEEIERRAAVAARFDERRNLLRLAADRYLFERSDVKEALRCYREYLDLAAEAESMEPRSDDSWLLIAMKQSRRQGGM